MSDTLTPRQHQVLHRLFMADLYSSMVFNFINSASFAFVATKQIKNPQRHLTILCFCFGFAALAQAVSDAIFSTNGHLNNEAGNILYAAS